MNKISKHFFLSLGFAHEKHFFFLLKFFTCFHRWKKKKLRKKSLGKKWQDIFVRKSFSEKPIFTRFHTFSFTKFCKGKKKVLFSQKMFFIHIFHPLFLDLLRDNIKRIKDIILANVSLHLVSLEKIPQENQQFRKKVTKKIDQQKKRNPHSSLRASVLWMVHLQTVTSCIVCL